MTPHKLLDQAETQGVHLWVEGSVLRYRGYSHAVQALLPIIRIHKSELLQLLSGRVPMPDPPGEVRPLSESALAELITRVAIPHGLDPLDLWHFLSAEDIEAIQTGNPDEHRALWAFAESRSRTGDRMTGGHDLPFPGTNEAPTGSTLVCCGDCAHFQPDRIGNGTGIGSCKKGIEPHSGLMYPKVTRFCRSFQEAMKSGKS
jgi:hypothetical protein